MVEPYFTPLKFLLPPPIKCLINHGFREKVRVVVVEMKNSIVGRTREIIQCKFDIKEGVSKHALCFGQTHGSAPTAAVGANPCVRPAVKRTFDTPSHISSLFPLFDFYTLHGVRFCAFLCGFE